MAVRTVVLLLSALLSCMALAGCGEGTFLGREPPYPAVEAEDVVTSVDPATGLRWISVDALPDTARATLTLLHAEGSSPAPVVGTPFANDDALLPAQADGYYTAYSVPDPDGGAATSWHLVLGAEFEVFWTANDFATFRRVQE